MLQSIREHSQGWLAWLIVAFISIPFALWGINSYLSGSSNVTVASVNDVDITLSQYQNALQNYRNRLQAMLGEGFDLNQMDQSALKQDVINGLVEQQLLKQFAHENGMRISDSQLASMIQSLDAFKDKSGQFSQAIYERQLLRSNASPAEFEEQLRVDLVLDQLRQAISGSEFVTDTEKNQYARLLTQKRDIVFVQILADQFKDKIQLSEDEVIEYYKQNKEQFKTKESVKIKYIDLSVDTLAKQVDVTDDILKEYYQSNLDKYTLDEKRIAQHVLIALKPDAKPEEVKKASERAEKIYKLIKSGVEFDDIPQNYEDLLGPEDEVARTGAISKGVMDPEFDEKLFSMKVDDITEPVRTKHGFHIIKLVEIQKAKTSSFDEVREAVENTYRKEQAETKYFEVADELQNLVFENPDSLEPAADALGLKIKESGYFTRAGGKDEITKNPSVIKVAFNPNVLNGANSEPIEISDTHLVVLRVVDHKPAVVKPLGEVQEEIKTILQNEKAKLMAEERGETILKRLEAGVDRDQVAEEFGFEWTVKSAVNRDDPQVKRSILRAAFRLGRPEAGKPVYDGFTDGRYDYAVVGVLAVKDTNIKWTMGDDTVKKAIERQVQQRNSVAWQDFIALLKQKADIEIFSDAL